ncbi:hypothetical protein CMO91_04835 [Candidatus Woesearchaeota archaeon]|nr:hypothetical protein [Candidatus Woesearchaeota archaeon]
MEEKMEKTTVEGQGRVFLPKKLRERAGIRPGQDMLIDAKEGEIVLKTAKSWKEFSTALKGCVASSKIDPLQVKNIWRQG